MFVGGFDGQQGNTTQRRTTEECLYLLHMENHLEHGTRNSYTHTCTHTLLAGRGELVHLNTRPHQLFLGSMHTLCCSQVSPEPKPDPPPGSFNHHQTTHHHPHPPPEGAGAIQHHMGFLCSVWQTCRPGGRKGEEGGERRCPALCLQLAARQVNGVV